MHATSGCEKLGHSWICNNGICINPSKHCCNPPINPANAYVIMDRSLYTVFHEFMSDAWCESEIVMRSRVGETSEFLSSSMMVSNLPVGNLLARRRLSIILHRQVVLQQHSQPVASVPDMRMWLSKIKGWTKWKVMILRYPQCLVNLSSFTSYNLQSTIGLNFYFT